jgi:hypothetical protein
MFGIKAGTLFNLLELGLVNARFKRVRGEQKAMTLWEVKSVRDYILNPETDMPKTANRTETVLKSQGHTGGHICNADLIETRCINH